MEDQHNTKDPLRECTSIYFNRLAHYTVYGAIFGSIVSMVMLIKLKRGFLFGVGLGAGYCHEDLLKIYHSYCSKKKTHSMD